MEYHTLSLSQVEPVVSQVNGRLLSHQEIKPQNSF